MAVEGCTVYCTNYIYYTYKCTICVSFVFPLSTYLPITYCLLLIIHLLIYYRTVITYGYCTVLYSTYYLSKRCRGSTKVQFVLPVQIGHRQRLECVRAAPGFPNPRVAGEAPARVDGMGWRYSKDKTQNTKLKTRMGVHPYIL